MEYSFKSVEQWELSPLSKCGKDEREEWNRNQDGKDFITENSCLPRQQGDDRNFRGLIGRYSTKKGTAFDVCQWSGDDHNDWFNNDNQ